MSTVVLYHASCADGFGAAYAAWKKLGDAAIYVPAQYGQPYPPEIDGGLESLYILDFSYPLETLLRLNRSVERMVIRDHHRTAGPALQEFAQMQDEGQISGVDVLFDESKSGAVLAWEHFFPGEPVPELLLYVQDRDLWRWELPDSREVSAALRSYPFDFRTWDGLDGSWDTLTRSQLEREGAALLRFQEQQVDSMCRHASLQDVAGHRVPVVNATGFISEVGEALCHRYPDAPFSASFFVRADGKRVWSLRSRNGFDVGAVAKTQGGGGHPAAAGFVENAE